MQPILSVQHVKKYYGNQGNITKAVEDISLQVEAGEFVGVMGASGSGKTTLLNVISTIDSVTAGHIFLSGRDLTELREKELAQFRRENLGFIFQDFNLLDILTLHENIALSLTIARVPAGRIDERVIQAAKRLGIEEILSKFPYEVSGGQKQRCACARALVTDPKLICADEPTGALDSKSAQMLMETLSDMNASLSSTILMVTHDAFSASYCGRILFLKDGKIFNELRRGQKSRRQFFNEILDTMALLGGDLSDVR